MKILVCGSGSGAIQFGVLLRKFDQGAEIDFYSRPTERNLEFARLNSAGHLTFTVNCEDPSLGHFCGSVTPGTFSASLESLKGSYDLVVLAGPVFTYHEVLKALIAQQLLKEDVVIVTASSYLGTGAVLLKMLDDFSAGAGLVLFGDYLAVSTRDRNSAFNSFIRAEKSHVKIHISEKVAAPKGTFFTEYLRQYIQNIQYLPNPWEVTQGNTNLFHVPLVVHDSLKERYFNPDASDFYFYAPYPSGAMSYDVVLDCIKFEEELLATFELLGLGRINFLKFRLDRGELGSPFIDQSIIERYGSLPQLERAGIYILYSWLYERKSLGLDQIGGGQSDKASLARFPRVRVTAGKGELPRIPLEDYACLKGIVLFGKRIGKEFPVARSLCELFENCCESLPAKFGYALDFDKATFESVARYYADTFVSRAGNCSAAKS